MQAGMLTVLGLATLSGMRRIGYWQRQGYPRTARRLYQRMAWTLGGLIWAAMAAQETLLLLSGQLTWRSGLPLHVCSFTGVLTLPMLLTGNRVLWHWSLYLGLPGALAALMFPSIVVTPWPGLMTAAFHLLHCCLTLAPLLPLAMGKRPSPWGAAQAMSCLVVLGGVALAVNALTGGNYLFLALPAPGTPLSPMAANGLTMYRVRLALVCVAVLTAEGAMVWLLRRRWRVARKKALR